MGVLRLIFVMLKHIGELVTVRIVRTVRPDRIYLELPAYSGMPPAENWLNEASFESWLVVIYDYNQFYCPKM